MTTPTPLDIRWLRQELATALAAAPAGPSTPVALPRATLELLSAFVGECTTPDGRRPRRYFCSDDELRQRVFAEMRRLAHEGRAPSVVRWDKQRSRELPSGAHICDVFGERWTTLCTAAGLACNPYRGDPERSPIDFADVEMPERPADPVIDDDPGMATIGAPRVEVVQVAGDRRIIREYHTLR